ncbi:MAG TPA: HAD-IA family hydrolase, partial [Acidimicrobiales bacterium]|nr:HAD-IA family hydrolase [Acidimicrobiales bacterium]
RHLARWRLSSHRVSSAGRGPLQAVIFDVDGTLVDSERDGHRVAFNMAFEEFDLPYRWDVDEYGELLSITGGQRRIDHYLADQGVDDEERERLAPALHKRKTEILNELVEEGKVEVRPGAHRLLDELVEAGTELAVATTGSRGWVDRLLRRLLPDIEFGVIVTGDDVSERRPDPEAFTIALERLEEPAENVVAVEDSDNGVEAAVAAGLACVAVVNGYTRDQDLEGAGLVLDGFGEPDAPAEVLADRAGTGCQGVLDRETLERLLG